VHLKQVAVQLYTLRDHCRTASELAASLARVRQIGYEAVQVSGVGPIPPREIRQLIDDAGLVLCATHENSDLLLNQPEQAIERLQEMGCTLTAYPYPAGIDLASPEAIAEFARRLNATGAKLRAAGITLGYHNHAVEFARTAGTTVFDYLSDHTSPTNLVFELDTYWAHFGGRDVVELCHRLAGRMPFLHLKDYCIRLDNTASWCEIGRGSLPFDRIISAAEEGGCKWFIVEQDTCPGDPFESLQISFDYIRQHLVGPVR
jgi:sugar phosphate isomerase/epimerase